MPPGKDSQPFRHSVVVGCQLHMNNCKLDLGTFTARRAAATSPAALRQNRHLRRLAHEGAAAAGAGGPPTAPVTRVAVDASKVELLMAMLPCDNTL